MSPELQAFASGFPLMLLQLGLGLVLFAFASGAYVLLSPHSELRRVRDGGTAAAVSLGGALVGLAIPLAATMLASTSLVGLALWATSALVLSLLGFRIVDIALTGLPKRVQDGQVAAAAVLVAAKLAVALIIAAAVVI